MDVQVTIDVLNNFYENGQLPITEIGNGNYYPNQFLILKDVLGSSSSALAIVDSSRKFVKKLVFDHEHIWGIRPRNVQQTMAIEMLLKKDMPLVTLIGKAGTGKTLLALASGLMQTEDFGDYKKLLVARPIVPMGKDLGFLPGEKEEKITSVDAAYF